MLKFCYYVHVVSTCLYARSDDTHKKLQQCIMYAVHTFLPDELAKEANNATRSCACMMHALSASDAWFSLAESLNVNVL